MPKLNATHLPSRIQEVIDQLERGEEVETKKNKTLLSDEQQKALDDAWAKQQALRKKHKPPKTEEERIKLGWKDKREVRIEIYKQALEKLNANIVDGLKDLLRQKEIRAARVYLEGRFAAKDGTNKDGAGKIALVRAGLRIPAPLVAERDIEIRKLEQQILEQAEDRLSYEEREHLEWLREGKKPAKKIKKA